MGGSELSMWRRKSQSGMRAGKQSLVAMKDAVLLHCTAAREGMSILFYAAR